MDEVAAYFLVGVVFGSTEAPFVKGAEGVVVQGAVAAGAHYYGAFYAPIDAYNATHDNAPADSRITQCLRINRSSTYSTSKENNIFLPWERYFSYKRRVSL